VKRTTLLGVVGLATLVAICVPWSQSARADPSVYSPTRFDDPTPDGCRFDDCSLREAFIAANSGAGGGTVYLALPGTYVLTRTIDPVVLDTEQTGDLDVTTSITVTGSAFSADSTVIDANYIDRGIDIANNASLYLFGVTVVHGRAQKDPRTGHFHGGGIHNHGQLTLVDSALSRNCSPSGWGGGGLTNAGTGKAVLQNVTIAADCAGSFGYGGGIENLGNLKLFNVTIAENSADANHGGGLSNISAASTARLNNTIVATNSTGGDCAGTITSVGHNLAGDGTCSLNAGGDIPAADPLFEQALLNVAGEPYLFTLLPSSPALDAGSGSYDTATDIGCPGPDPNTPDTDEIGTPRPQDGNDDGVKQCDIGAYERPDPPPKITNVSPIGGATAVPAGSNVRVTFNEPMDHAATQAAFSLARKDTATVVGGSFSWSGNTMIFNPSANLTAGRTYTARVTTAARDAAGTYLETAKQWQFTIARATAYPASTVITTGTLRAGDAARLRADDGSYFQVDSTTAGTRTVGWYGRFSSIPNGLAKLQVTYKGKNSVSCTQAVALYNFTAGSWTQIDSRSVGSTEVGLTISPSGPPGDYVSGTSGGGELRLRITCHVASPSFFESGDLMKITYAAP
jgi:hypothetical protein